ncbi:hypothetical protein LO762_07435 [Actinocorallia sp. API 0066]|uniref:hypothetical protein n=1 Tax=Actinocorallia sp. API 0066 TaxID=2896846 RepID=UPI001E487E73|nr:hypothetical protein [Actinocorallia sp. API 0066]MCD0449022.1 hypothetical protein [Actinocorallia sp. API 0066]
MSSAVNLARWGVVPYITAWSSEETPPVAVVVRDGRIAYADERAEDRDGAGVLWTRIGFSPGVGVPQFKSVHFLRQRRAMRGLLCQVCGARCAKSALWMLSREEYEGADGPWPAPVMTAHPPVCPGCVERSARLCPHLRAGHVVLRPRRVSPAAISGVLYQPTRAGLVPSAATIAHNDFRTRWLRAAQLHVTLEDYDVVGLGAMVVSGSGGSSVDRGSGRQGV